MPKSKTIRIVIYASLLALNTGLIGGLSVYVWGSWGYLVSIPAAYITGFMWRRPIE